MRKWARLEACCLFVEVRTWPVRGAIFWTAQTRLPRWIEAACAPVRFCIVRSARPPSSVRMGTLIQPRRRAGFLNASLRQSLAGPWATGRPRAWQADGAQASRCPCEAGGRRASPRPRRRRVEHRLPAVPVRAVEHRPAAVPVRPADVRPVAPPYVAPAPARAVEHGPAPATLTEYWLATGGRAPAAMAGTVPHTEEKIPYNSLMDALGRATPAMLTEAEKAGLPVPVPAIRSPGTMASPKRLPWRGLLAVSALVITAGLSAYVLLSRGGKDGGASQVGQTASAADAGGDWVDIPLPARRPAGLRRRPKRRA